MTRSPPRCRRKKCRVRLFGVELAALVESALARLDIGVGPLRGIHLRSVLTAVVVQLQAFREFYAEAFPQPFGGAGAERSTVAISNILLGHPHQQDDRVGPDLLFSPIGLRFIVTMLRLARATGTGIPLEEAAYVNGVRFHVGDCFGRDGTALQGGRHVRFDTLDPIIYRQLRASCSLHLCRASARATGRLKVGTLRSKCGERSPKSCADTSPTSKRPSATTSSRL